MCVYLVCKTAQTSLTFALTVQRSLSHLHLPPSAFLEQLGAPRLHRLTPDPLMGWRRRLGGLSKLCVRSDSLELQAHRTSTTDLPMPQHWAQVLITCCQPVTALGYVWCFPTYESSSHTSITSWLMVSTALPAMVGIMDTIQCFGLRGPCAVTPSGPTSCVYSCNSVLILVNCQSWLKCQCSEATLGAPGRVVSVHLMRLTFQPWSAVHND